MKDQLPNLRLIGLESSQWGQDWQSLVQEIDQKIEDHSYELSAQDIFIEFRQWPHLSKVMIYRSIIGPLKEIEPPYILTDWESTGIDRFELRSDTWVEMFEEISQIRQNNAEKSDFIILFSRRFETELTFNKQVLFR